MAGVNPLEAELRALLNCLCTALGDAGWVGECCIEPGVPAFDQCCESGGKAWARVIEIFPTAAYPNHGGPVNLASCETEWAMRVELGAVTCVSADPNCDELAADASRVLAMIRAAMVAMTCCGDGKTGANEDLRMIGIEGVGPEGGCAGFHMEVVVPAAACCPP